ncbi:MAG: hypothetical protein J0M34_01700 [Alphaproteobacteria bacterium]|nr:hypothetical protein [Alphaproteobacteria bacterium]
MNVEEEQKTNKNGLAPADFKTHGEKTHHAIFNSALNFWLNLTASAAFSYWAAHSHNKIKLNIGPIKPINFKGLNVNHSPSEIQTNLGNWLLTKTPLFKGLSNKNYEEARKRSHAVAEVVTLLMPGFAIMVPSVWLGEKYKSSIVRYFDKQKYGEHPEDNPVIAERYAILDAQKRPTLLGAVTARFGTMALTMGTSRLIGSEGNFIHGFGKAIKAGDIKPLAGSKAANYVGNALEQFPGVNPIAGNIGTEIGTVINRMLPQSWSKGIVKFFSKHDYSWSNDQMKRAAHDLADTNLVAKAQAGSESAKATLVEAEKTLIGKPFLEAAKHGKPSKDVINNYDQPLQNFSKYISMDVLYTLITATAVHPVLNLLGFIPGMKYTPKNAEPHPEIEKKRIPRVNYGYDKAEMPAERQNEPSTRIEQASYHDRVAAHELRAARSN